MVPTIPASLSHAAKGTDLIRKDFHKCAEKLGGTWADDSFGRLGGSTHNANKVACEFLIQLVWLLLGTLVNRKNRNVYTTLVDCRCGPKITEDKEIHEQINTEQGLKCRADFSLIEHYFKTKFKIKEQKQLMVISIKSLPHANNL